MMDSDNQHPKDGRNSFRFWKTFLILSGVFAALNIALVYVLFSNQSPVAEFLLFPIYIAGSIFDHFPFGDIDMILTYTVTPIVEALCITCALSLIAKLRSK